MGSDFNLLPGIQLTSIFYDTDDANAGIFPQAVVRKASDNSVEATVNLSAISGQDGTYSGTFTPSAEGEFNIRITPFKTSSHTTRHESYGIANSKLQVKNIVSGAVTGQPALGFISDDLTKFADKFVRLLMRFKMGDDRTFKQQIESKSEFDVANDIVKTNLVIPDAIDTRPELEKQNKILSQIHAMVSGREKLFNNLHIAIVQSQKILSGSIGNIPTTDLHPLIEKFEIISEELKGLKDNGIQELGVSMEEKINKVKELIPQDKTGEVLKQIGKVGERVGDKSFLDVMAFKNIVNTLKELKTLSNDVISKIGQNSTQSKEIKVILGNMATSKDVTTASVSIINRLISETDILESLIQAGNQKNAERHLSLVNTFRGMLGGLLGDIKKEPNKEDEFFR